MKIRDRMLLGILSGLTANVGKNITMLIFGRLGFSQKSFQDVGAGFFLSPRETKTFAGQIVGLLCDFSIAMTIATANVYHLSYSGRDHWFLKGLATGSVFWSTMYGFLGKVGNKTSVFPVTAKTAISSFIGHALFGISANYIVVKLADPVIFSRNPAYHEAVEGEIRAYGKKFKIKQL